MGLTQTYYVIYSPCKPQYKGIDVFWGDRGWGMLADARLFPNSREADECLAGLYLPDPGDSAHGVPTVRLVRVEYGRQIFMER